MQIIERCLWVLSFLFAVYQLLLPVYAFMPNLRERSLHLMFALTLIFFRGAARRTRVHWIMDTFFAVAGSVSCLYIFVQYHSVIQQYGVLSGHLQLWMGLVLVISVLEAARRMVGPTLPGIALLFLLYAMYGHWIPGEFGHPEYDLTTVVSMLYLTTGGLWGQLLGVSANMIAVFVFLGALIVFTGGGNGFMKLSIRLGGRYVGGPAKVSTISSALFGSISGSASANVASTGAFTIPMMKRLRYSPELAAAVEAVASTGGQIMPPVMGAGAFIMAELLQTPYLTIAMSALIPACLYFFCVGTGIHFHARKKNHQPVPAQEIPDWEETIKTSIFFLIPFSILIFWMYMDYSPQYAAFWAALSTILLALFNAQWKWDSAGALPRYRHAVLTGARQAALIAGICATAQIVVSVIAFTGLGVKMTACILNLSGDSLFPALCLTALASIILGIEVPTTAAYVVAVVVSGPVLIQLGVPAMAAHLFVYYFAILSAITPPVCGAVFIAAGMAEADWLKTAKLGFALGFSAFLLPFMFVFNPSLILMGTPLSTISGVCRAGLSLVFFSSAVSGFLTGALGPIARMALVAGGILILTPAWLSSLSGVLVGACVWYVSKGKPRAIHGTRQDNSVCR